MARCHNMADHLVACRAGARHSDAWARLTRTASLIIAALLVSATRVAAWDSSPAKTNIAVPSVEELAMPPANPVAARESDTRESICLIVEAAARDANLPLEFFARVIWQESRFQADAVGPMTRSGEHAQGIAQFMPGTASERGLLNPFNPVQALPKSAEFLNELRNQFGNLGLAAAAYNAGPRRVQEWLAGTGGMPEQTRNYVYAITGTSVDAWAKAGATGKGPPSSPPTSCRDLMALLKRAPNAFVAELEQHVELAAAKVWGVQLAAGFDRNRALAMYSRAVTRLTAVIGDRDPSLLSSVMRSRGTRAFYQVRIGADTRSEADDLCNRIRKAGGACFVLKNRGVSG
ncbi:transglycosylase SLT domain-containing protein [Bradyrhizobium sp. 956_D2_N1_5]|uniref:transglycosylase SLT domain-containing protein n=1 Tax=unclassified Bradyrhizobium TaxID=2631580 RepID=UPI003F25BA74